MACFYHLLKNDKWLSWELHWLAYFALCFSFGALCYDDLSSSCVIISAKIWLFLVVPGPFDLEMSFQWLLIACRRLSTGFASAYPRIRHGSTSCSIFIVPHMSFMECSTSLLKCSQIFLARLLAAGHRPICTRKFDWIFFHSKRLKSIEPLDEAASTDQNTLVNCGRQ